MAKYKVIQIIDDYSVLINYGRNNGAIIDTQVQIIEIGPDIKDPDTDKVLGTFDHIKANLTITEVYDNFSLCQKKKTRAVVSFVNPLTDFNNLIVENVKLNVDPKQISNIKRPDNDVIQVGDTVIIL